MHDTDVATETLPQSTYRLQFHAGFTFKDAAAIVPYLHDLGITHCYASPYLKARAGSTHGYDVVDPRVLNPEIGREEDHAAWVSALRAHGMGHILDIVPNHMGVATNDNPWWNDVLENGPASVYAAFFDIDWRASPRPELHNRLLLPILGEPYGDVLEKGQLKLAFEAGAFIITYFERRLPVKLASYGRILGRCAGELGRAMGPHHAAVQEYESILAAIRSFPRSGECRAEKETVKRRLAALAGEHPLVRQCIDRATAQMNGVAGEPGSFDALHELLEEQCYRLAYWQVASDEVNYRRFFDVNELAAQRMERQEVFDATHALVLRLLAEGRLDGLRIDHPDGLYDPAGYFERLQRHYRAAIGAGEHGERCPLYMVAEKILAMDEPLPDDWAVHGTSGYDFLNMVNGLLVDAAGEEPLTRFYGEWSGNSSGFEELVYEKKRLILQTSLASELNMLAHQLGRLSQRHRCWRDFTLSGLHTALCDVIACFPVYRCYTCGPEAGAADRRHVGRAIDEAIRRNPKVSPAVFHFIRDILLLRHPEGAPEELRERQRRFVGRFQQVTAPTTAKGVEDTAFYVYNRLTSLNEVGGDPARFGVSPQRLHQYLGERQAKWPHSLSALSTHDTKRSEDVRARISVLSEMPAEWEQRVRRWSGMNRPHRQMVEGAAVPHPNEEYLLYQTLVGAWPLEGGGDESFVQRMQAYMLKASREAKVHTGWTSPNIAYEQAVNEFVARILDPRLSDAFLDDFRAFQGTISHFGLLNSLSQTLLRIAAPGVPDTYQGTELWDFSLVDPDNRRPVDYPRRARMLGELRSQVKRAGANRRELVRGLLENMTDSRVKLFVTWQALECRRRLTPLFTAGDYIPVGAAGARQANVFAFARHHAGRWALVVVPRLVSQLAGGPHCLPLGQEAWQDTLLRLPREMAHAPCRNVFTGDELAVTHDGGQSAVRTASVFSAFPVALFTTS